jgi:hypothetical protein
MIVTHGYNAEQNCYWTRYSERKPMTTPRCDTCPHESNIRELQRRFSELVNGSPMIGAGFLEIKDRLTRLEQRFNTDNPPCPPPQHSEDEWHDAHLRLSERTRNCLHEVGSPMARLDRGERSEDLWQAIQHILNQHTEDEWFALYGRFIGQTGLVYTEYSGVHEGNPGIAITFELGDRSESLWNQMQQAVNP